MNQGGILHDIYRLPIYTKLTPWKRKKMQGIKNIIKKVRLNVVNKKIDLIFFLHGIIHVLKKQFLITTLFIK
jgi:hypothetical protein